MHLGVEPTLANTIDSNISAPQRKQNNTSATKRSNAVTGKTSHFEKQKHSAVALNVSERKERLNRSLQANVSNFDSRVKHMHGQSDHGVIQLGMNTFALAPSMTQPHDFIDKHSKELQRHHQS